MRGRATAVTYLSFSVQFRGITKHLVLAIIPRHLKIGIPDANPSGTCNFSLFHILIGVFVKRNGISFGDHTFSKIHPCNNTSRNWASVEIYLGGGAVNRTVRNLQLQTTLCRSPTNKCGAILGNAALTAFGSIDPRNAKRSAVDFYRIAIDYACKTSGRHLRFWRCHIPFNVVNQIFLIDRHAEHYPTGRLAVFAAVSIADQSRG